MARPIVLLTALCPGSDPKWTKWEPYFEAAYAAKQDYCSRHGYDVHCVRAVDFSRHPAWAKIHVTRELLSRHDWVFWTDADAIIANPNRKLEDLIDPSYDWIVGSDWNGLNTGQMLVQNTYSAREALDRVWENPAGFEYRHGYEQGALKLLIRNHSLGDVRVLVTDQNVMNSCPTKYRSGDFIVHFANWRRSRMPRFIPSVTAEK
jgi:galactosyl transferase GMA12/MNN10 family